MDIETLSAINEDTYRVVVMLIQGFTLVVGLASLMFVVVAVVCAAWDRLGDLERSARGQMNATPRAFSNYSSPSRTMLSVSRVAPM